jgi:hypothetical protein
VASRPTRKAVVVTVVVVAAVLAGYGLYWYAPWMLATDTTVDEPLMPVVPAAEAGVDRTHTTVARPYRLMGGAFVSQQHRTSGTARVVRLPGSSDAGMRLELVDFDTSNGPDLRVWLSDQPVEADRSGWRVFGTGRRVDLGELKGSKGNQTYAIPLDTDLAGLRSVTIWSERFTVSYGAATLS